MSAGQFLLVLRARWKAAFGTLAIALAIAVALSFVLPKKYTAFSSVVVDVKGDPVAGTAYPAQVTTSTMSTQIDIVQSARVHNEWSNSEARSRRGISPEVARPYRGTCDITAWIADLLEDDLTVTPSHESNVINIAFTWPDAKVAAALANAFAEADIATNIELRWNRRGSMLPGLISDPLPYAQIWKRSRSGFRTISVKKGSLPPTKSSTSKGRG